MVEQVTAAKGPQVMFVAGEVVVTLAAEAGAVLAAEELTGLNCFEAYDALMTGSCKVAYQYAWALSRAGQKEMTLGRLIEMVPHERVSYRVHGDDSLAGKVMEALIRAKWLGLKVLEAYDRPETPAEIPDASAEKNAE